MAKRDQPTIYRVTFKYPVLLGMNSVVYHRLMNGESVDNQACTVTFDNDVRFLRVETPTGKLVDRIPLANIASLSELKD